MSLFQKIKDSFESKLAEILAISAGVVIIWAGGKISNIIYPMLEQSLSIQLLLPITIASLFINLLGIILISIYYFHKKSESELKLHSGVYWDTQKNPYCPICKTPVSAYDDYGLRGKGYWCKGCKKVFPLADSLGNRLSPQDVISKL